MIQAAVIGFALALGNVTLALITTRLVRNVHELQQYFRIIIIGLSIRTGITLILFGILYLRMGEHQLSFGLSFILSFAVMLGVEVYIIHRMESGNAPKVPLHLQRRTQNSN